MKPNYSTQPAVTSESISPHPHPFAKMLTVLFFAAVAMGSIPTSFANPTNGEPEAVQEECIKVIGYVKTDGKKVPGAVAYLYKNNKLISWSQVDRRSAFRFNLPIDSYCTVEVLSDGYHPKRVGFYTAAEKGSAVPFKLKMEMISEDEIKSDADIDDMDFPSALLFYNQYKKRFEIANNYYRASKRYYGVVVKGNIRNRFKRTIPNADDRFSDDKRLWKLDKPQRAKF